MAMVLIGRDCLLIMVVIMVVVVVVGDNNCTEGLHGQSGFHFYPSSHPTSLLQHLPLPYMQSHHQPYYRHPTRISPFLTNRRTTRRRWWWWWWWRDSHHRFLPLNLFPPFQRGW